MAAQLVTGQPATTSTASTATAAADIGAHPGLVDDSTSSHCSGCKRAYKRQLEKPSFRFHLPQDIYEGNVPKLGLGSHRAATQHNDLRSLLAWQGSSIPVQAPKTNGSDPKNSPRRVRKIHQHDFEVSVHKAEEERAAVQHVVHHNKILASRGATESLHWDPGTASTVEAPKRRMLGGMTTEQFTSTLKRREAVQAASEEANRANRSVEQYVLSSSVQLGWEAGSSWNPTSGAESHFQTSYGAQNSGKRVGDPFSLQNRTRRLGRNRHVLQSTLRLG